MNALLLAFALAAAGGPIGDGEARLSIDVREVDARDVLGLLAEAGGRQSVVDGDVACRFTLKVKELRWRDAFEQVLRACRLGVEEDGPVLRVAPLQRLAEERRERRALVDEQARSQRSTWTALRLSYARAAELAPVLAKFLPPGSQVTFDARTNTLFVQASGVGR